MASGKRISPDKNRIAGRRVLSLKSRIFLVWKGLQYCHFCVCISFCRIAQLFPVVHTRYCILRNLKKLCSRYIALFRISMRKTGLTFRRGKIKNKNNSWLFSIYCANIKINHNTLSCFQKEKKCWNSNFCTKMPWKNCQFYHWLTPVYGLYYSSVGRNKHYILWCGKLSVPVRL